MQSIILLLVSAMQLLNMVSANPNLPADFKTNAIKIAINAVQTAQDSLKDNSLASTTVTTQITSSDQTVTPIQVVTPTPIFGNVILTPEPTPMPTPTPQPEIKCTLSSDTNVGTPSGYVTLTWTSNADSATLTNNHIAFAYPYNPLSPITGGSKSFQLSSESGENNIFTAHFSLNGQSKDCTTQVLIQ